RFREAGTSAFVDGDRALEFAGRRKDGSEIQLEVALSTLGDPGSLARRTLAIVRDVTGRRHAEEAASRLAAMVDSSDDALIGKTLDGVITSWNPAAQRLYGYAAEEGVGRSIPVLVPPDRPAEVPEILRRLR